MGITHTYVWTKAQTPQIQTPHKPNIDSKFRKSQVPSPPLSSSLSHISVLIRLWWTPSSGQGLAWHILWPISHKSPPHWQRIRSISAHCPESPDTPKACYTLSENDDESQTTKPRPRRSQIVKPKPTRSPQRPNKLKNWNLVPHASPRTHSQIPPMHIL